MGYPIWYHHHGSKMKVKEVTRNPRLLIIAGSAASVRVAHRATTLFRTWDVEWKIVFGNSTGINGTAVFTSEELESAFGLSDNRGTFSDWLIERFGADSASQGKYIRWKDYLNIPCPGTGHDGDPNVSICLDEEIQNAVRQFLD